MKAVLATGASVLLIGCSHFEKSSPPAIAPALEVPVRVAIEQSQGLRDITTGERKFVFCTGADCVAPSRKTSQPSPRLPAVLAPSSPPAAPAPSVKSFQVAFDYDKSTLNERGIAVMEEAAEYALKSETTEIRIHGKADSFDRDAYNLKLADRRARTAERFFKGKKIQANLIVDSSIVRVSSDGVYPAGETFKGRRVDLDIVIEVVAKSSVQTPPGSQ